jgi:hypothetical protein
MPCAVRSCGSRTGQSDSRCSRGVASYDPLARIPRRADLPTANSQGSEGLDVVKFWSSGPCEGRPRTATPLTAKPRKRGKRRSVAKGGYAPRVNRTQEVAGSSPASSMKPPQSGGFSFSPDRACLYPGARSRGRAERALRHETRVGRGILERERQDSHRDLRRDRPVLPLPSCPGIRRGSRREQGVSHLALRGFAVRLRAPAGTSCGIGAGCSVG